MADASNGTGIDHVRRGVRFDPTINLGHIVTAGVFLATTVAAWVTLDARVSGLERGYQEEKATRREGDSNIETRFMREVTTQRAHMDQTQVRVADDIREIKTLMRDGFRDLDQKLDKKADRPGR